MADARRPVRPPVVAGLVLAATAACSGAPEEPGTPTAAWDYTRTEEGGVTRIVTHSGSKWGGNGILVEELSIGVAEGADEYMLGGISGLWVTDDEVYVLDLQLPAVRVYDRRDGTYRRDVGSPGQGPGEYERPFGIAIDTLGTVHVTDGRRVLRYAADGSVLTPLQMPGFSIGGLVITEDRRVLVPTMILPEVVSSAALLDQQPAYQELAEWGETNEPIAIPMPEYDNNAWTLGRAEARARVPFAPRTLAGITGAGVPASGVGSEYAIRFFHPDGRVIESVREVEPAAMSDEERAYHHDHLVARMNRRYPGWTWTGPEVPTHKPHFSALIGDPVGRLLVVRHAPSKRADSCVENPTAQDFADGRPAACWVTRYAWDFFNADGEYLGEVERPDIDATSGVFMGEDVFAIPVEDEAGVIQVKVYRLVLPGEASEETN